MGYNTDFTGYFELDRALTVEHLRILEELASGSQPEEDGCPGGYCQWIPSDNGEGIEYDGGEKFYDYVPWIRYIADKFLTPWGYKLNGEVEWRGEDPHDMGIIIATDNVITTKRGKIVYE